MPKLQSVGQVCTFLRWQRNFKIPSSAAFGQIGDGRAGFARGVCHVAVGFTNRDLIPLVGALLQEPYTSRHATYDLRRLIRKGLIVKIPHTRRYQLTIIGRRVAVLFTKTYGRVLAPGLGALDPRLPEAVADRSPLAVAWNRFESALNDFVEENLVAA